MCCTNIWCLFCASRRKIPPWLRLEKKKAKPCNLFPEILFSFSRAPKLGASHIARRKEWEKLHVPKEKTQPFLGKTCGSTHFGGETKTPYNYEYVFLHFFWGGNRGESAAPFRTITFPRLCNKRTSPPQYTGDIQEGKEGRRGTYHLFLIRRGLLAAETEEADMIVTDLVTSLLCAGGTIFTIKF